MHLNDRCTLRWLTAKGTLPNATNDFCLELSWPTGKLPVVCTRFGAATAVNGVLIHSACPHWIAIIFRRVSWSAV